MIKIKQAVIVEGKYDKIKLSSVIDGIIIETDGFGIFNNKEKQKLIRKLAETKKYLFLGKSIKEACVLSGFHDYANFIRSFKKSVGVSPGKYAMHN